MIRYSSDSHYGLYIIPNIDPLINAHTNIEDKFYNLYKYLLFIYSRLIAVRKRCHFYSPSCCSKSVYNFLLLLNTKEDILKNVGLQALYLFSILWKSMAAFNVLVNYSFKVAKATKEMPLLILPTSEIVISSLSDSIFDLRDAVVSDNSDSTWR